MTKTRKRLCSKAKGGHAGNRKPVTLGTWDFGAKGQANQIGLVVEDAAEMTPEGKAANPNGVKRARRVDMLELWYRRGDITAAGFNAAEKLRDAFEATERAPGWPDNDRVQSSPKPDHAVTIQIDRLSAYHAVARHVRDEDRDIIGHCVLMRGVPSGLRKYRWKAADGLVALRVALDNLAAAMQRR